MSIITQAIPTNIITGFLGVGKTTLILELLKQKPDKETWAVLVNEFGEVGIDGNMLSNAGIDKPQIAIREVPGGCMCCTSGLPMQIALNQLIARSNPSRLLIEPTGLGHPKEVIETLKQPHYQTTIDLKATLTLVDPRKLRDSRYTEHEIYQQQLQVADIILASKSDLCSTQDLDALPDFLKQLKIENTPVQSIEYGKLDYKQLNQSNGFKQAISTFANSHLDTTNHSHAADEHPNEELFIRKENQGKGYFSCGWIFDPVITFDYQALKDVLDRLNFTRLKAIFITEQGVFAFNKESDQLAITELDDCMDSRLEIISINQENWLELEQNLLQSCDYKLKKN